MRRPDSPQPLLSHFPIDFVGEAAAPRARALARAVPYLQEGYMLSSKARYALRALVELARTESRQATAAELAVRADAPRKFLEAILLSLSRAGLVVSRRGKFGGYALARAASQISFAEVIRVVDGPLALAPCVSQMAFRKCDDCPDLETCALREALMRARDATSEVLEGYTLADAAQTADQSGDQPAAI